MKNRGVISYTLKIHQLVAEIFSKQVTGLDFLGGFFFLQTNCFASNKCNKLDRILKIFEGIDQINSHGYSLTH
jgi:hypothetical protein